MAQPYAAAGIEPPLEELLDDQIARLVMRRDGIRPADVWRWVHQARAGWTHAPGAPAAAEGPGRVVPPQPEIGD